MGRPIQEASRQAFARTSRSGPIRSRRSRSCRFRGRPITRAASGIRFFNAVKAPLIQAASTASAPTKDKAHRGKGTRRSPDRGLIFDKREGAPGIRPFEYAAR